LRRYVACGIGGASPAAAITPAARALVEAMADLVPSSARSARATSPRMQAVEPSELAAGSQRDLSAGAVVETMMLPETGTVVMTPPSLSVQAPEAVTVVAAVRVQAAPAVAEPVAAPAEVAAVVPVISVAAAQTAVVGASAVDGLQPAIAGKKRARRGKGRNKRGGSDAARGTLAVGTPPAAAVLGEVVAKVAEPEAAEAQASQGSTLISLEPAAGEAADADVSAPECDDVASQPDPIPTATWAPKMPPIAAAPSVPWRRPGYAAIAASAAAPSLVIDDADPDSAERVLEERAEKHTPRRSFLPPILLDREDRSARQGGLTLAVILLLIAATLTLSYLMRRPSASGDGMTRLELAPHAGPTADHRIGSPAWS